MFSTESPNRSPICGAAPGLGRRAPERPIALVYTDQPRNDFNALFAIVQAPGRLDAVLEVPAENVTSCCFGGDDGRSLFVTTAAPDGNVYVSDWVNGWFRPMKCNSPRPFAVSERLRARQMLSLMARGRG